MSKRKAVSYLRISTSEQARGTGIARQMEASRRYAETHDLELAEGDQLVDLGISAYRSKNVRGGALGQFLDAVRASRVPPGTTLIVESLDRISRDEIRKALSTFLELINAGIDVVTLMDNRVYTRDKVEMVDLVGSLCVMERAFNESRTKSQRLSAAWRKKRERAREKPLTALCPAWLRLNDDRSRYEVIEERAEVVRTIFEESASGLGNYTITRLLNEARVPPFGRAKGWRTSTVAKILNSRAVLGEFQAHKLVGDERRPEGEAITDYFPRIIDDSLFYRARGARGERRVRGSGRKGPNVANIFSGLAVCAYCRSKMRFENKGIGPRGGTYLVCDTARRGLGCEKASWRYDQLEISFIAFVREVDIESLMQSETETRKRTELDDEVATLRGKLASTQEQRDRTYQLLMESTTAHDFLGKKLDELERRRMELEDLLNEKEKARVAMSDDLARAYESGEQVKSLIECLRAPSDDVYRLRAQMASKLRSIIDTILVAPSGKAPMIRRTIDFLRDQPESDDIIAHQEEKLREEDSSRRWFCVAFRNGTIREVIPADDPLKFESQMTSSMETGLVQEYPEGKITVFPPKKL
jgi:DNA invertase Pin-like site-specific DNA recombinase